MVLDQARRTSPIGRTYQQWACHLALTVWTKGLLIWLFASLILDFKKWSSKRPILNMFPGLGHTTQLSSHNCTARHWKFNFSNDFFYCKLKLSSLAPFVLRISDRRNDIIWRISVSVHEYHRDASSYNMLILLLSIFLIEPTSNSSSVNRQRMKRRTALDRFNRPDWASEVYYQ